MGIMSNPSKYEIERAFHRILSNGDESAIARELEHSVGFIQQLYDPNNERQSTLFRAIKELRAWRRESMERGSKALALFNHFVEIGLEDAGHDYERERDELQREIAEYNCAEMKDAPNKTEELRDVHFQTGKLLRMVREPSVREIVRGLPEVQKRKRR